MGQLPGWWHARQRKAQEAQEVQEPQKPQEPRPPRRPRLGRGRSGRFESKQAGRRARFRRKQRDRKNEFEELLELGETRLGKFGFGTSDPGKFASRQAKSLDKFLARQERKRNKINNKFKRRVERWNEFYKDEPDEQIDPDVSGLSPYAPADPAPWTPPIPYSPTPTTPPVMPPTPPVASFLPPATSRAELYARHRGLGSLGGYGPAPVGGGFSPTPGVRGASEGLFPVHRSILDSYLDFLGFKDGGLLRTFQEGGELEPLYDEELTGIDDDLDGSAGIFNDAREAVERTLMAHFAGEVLSAEEQADLSEDIQDFVEETSEEALAALVAAVQEEIQSGVGADEAELVSGVGDGMSDQIPANIDGVEDVALSSGEVVIPADAVSGVGNGDTEAGAGRLMAMVDRIREARTGTPVQAPPINPDEFLLA